VPAAQCRHHHPRDRASTAAGHRRNGTTRHAGTVADAHDARRRLRHAARTAHEPGVSRAVVADRPVDRVHCGRCVCRDRSGPRVAAAAAERRVMRTIRSEWTKLRTLPSTGWLLLVAAGCTVALGYAVTGTTRYDGCHAPCFEDTTELSLFGVRLGQIGVVVL